MQMKVAFVKLTFLGTEEFGGIFLLVMLTVATNFVHG